MKDLRNKPSSLACLLLAAGALWCTTATAAPPDPVFAAWLGKEITITSSTLTDHVPLAAKLTLVYDSEDDVVRVCTRSVPSRRATWRMDLAVPCNVALNFVRGTRYCTEDDVKSGDAETLSACHRLRSHDVAMHPAEVRGAVELHDLIVFLIKSPDSVGSTISILLDSPSRVTHGGLIGGHTSE